MQELEQQESLDTTQDASTEQPDSNIQTQQDIVELDKLEKFKFSGQDWTPKDLTGAILRQSDYTRKTQEIAQERKYYDNLSADLDAVKQNPQLMERFKQVYPEKYHNYLRYVTAEEKAAQQVQPQGVDQQFMKRFETVENALKEQRLTAINAELDAMFDKLGKKYTYADEASVIAKAQALLDRGQRLDEKTWDAVWKSEHDRVQAHAQKMWSDKIANQKQANAKARDVASGGGIPGQAPKNPRTIKEATNLAMRDLEQLN